MHPKLHIHPQTLGKTSAWAFILCSPFLSVLSPQIPDASSFPNFHLCCLTSEGPLCSRLEPASQSSLSGSLHCYSESLAEKKAEAHVICFPNCRNHSSALPAVQSPNIVALLILSGFLLGYSGKASSFPVTVLWLKQKPSQKIQLTRTPASTQLIKRNSFFFPWDPLLIIIWGSYSVQRAQY